MGSLHHSNATSTVAVRKEIQASKESAARLAVRFGLNEKTILKWRHAASPYDGKSGAKKPKSVLTEVDEGCTALYAARHGLAWMIFSYSYGNKFLF